MKNLTRIFSGLLLAVIIMLGATNVDAAKITNVNLRIEGYDKTLLEKSKVQVSSVDISDIVGGETNDWTKENPSVTHAIVKGLQDKGLDPKSSKVMNITANGNYIDSLFELDTFSTSNMDGWMYTVNNEIAPVGIKDYELKDGDNIVFYFTTNYTKMKYSFFDKENVDVNAGDNIILKNMSASFDMEEGNDVSGASVKGAYLILEQIKDNKVISTERKDIVSDQNGNLTFSIDKPGTYRALTWLGDEVYSGLSRAYTNIEVKADSVWASELIDYLPAPGQFTNEAGWSLKPESVLGELSNNGVSLGAFGGYMVLGFNEPIVNDAKNPYGIDFTVFGNAFTGNEEAGSVMVMKDENKNGKADDTWYELAGSRHFDEKTITDYKTTYTNPNEFANVPWSDNQGKEGVVKVNNFHKHNFYPEYDDYKKFTTNDKFSAREMTLSGTKIDEKKAAYGYFDVKQNNTGNDATKADNPYINQVKGTKAGGDGFDISWAVDKDGNKVELDQIDFVKVYNPNQLDAGMFGEVSPEVLGVAKAASDENTKHSENADKIELISENGKIKDFDYKKSQTDYNVFSNSKDKFKVKVTSNAENIIVNNERYDAQANPDGIEFNLNDEKIIRVVIQDGEDTAVINHIKVNYKADIKVKSVETVKAITAESNLTLTDILKKLPSKVTVIDENNEKSEQVVSWKIENYKQGQATKYKAIGTITLSDGYIFENDPIIVAAEVNVTKQQTTKTIKSGNNTYYYSLTGKVWFNNKTIVKQGNTTTTYAYKFSKNKVKGNDAKPKNGSLIYSRQAIVVNKNKVTSRDTYYYNNNELVTKRRLVVLNNKNKQITTQAYNRTYHSNQKVKQIYSINRNLSNGSLKNRQKINYNNKGKKAKNINLTYKNNKITKRVEYRYNKAGILRSNKKYGNSYRFITSYKKGKAKKTIRVKYNAKGKITQKRTVKVVKSF